jgi:xyloglucan-specific exo-beta-1,4-glucanase
MSMRCSKTTESNALFPVRACGGKVLLWLILKLFVVWTPRVAMAEEIKVEAYDWRHVEILAGGFVPGIVFSEKTPGLAYCRTDIGGAYRWDVDRKEWVPLMDWAGPRQYNLMGIESIAIDPVDSRKVYFAAGMYSGGKAAILRSSDQGRTYDILDVPFPMGGNENGRGMGERLAIDPNQTGTLYFGSRYDGLWVSKDSANTWTKVNGFPFQGIARRMRSGGAGISFVIFDPTSGVSGSATRTIFAGVADRSDANLYRSDDAGLSWNKVAGQPGAGLLPRHGVLDSVSGVLYVTYGNGVGPNGVTDGALWRLDLKSGAWTNVSPLIPGAAGAGSFGYGGLSLDSNIRGN